jgi:hypothetical protein
MILVPLHLPIAEITGTSDMLRKIINVLRNKTILMKMRKCSD